MRRLNGAFRGAVALSVIVLFSLSALAAPRETPNPRQRSNPIGKMVKKIIRTLGDGLIIPTP